MSCENEITVREELRLLHWLIYHNQHHTGEPLDFNVTEDVNNERQTLDE